MSMHTLRPRRVPAVPKGSPPSGIGPKARQKPSALLGDEPPLACEEGEGGSAGGRGGNVRTGIVVRTVAVGDRRAPAHLLQRGHG